jgi:hypothetical protein
MIGVALLLLLSAASDDARSFLENARWMKTPTKETVTLKISCGERDYYSVSYGHSSHSEIKGNRVFTRRDPVKLLSFETNAFEVSADLTESLETAISAYSYLSHIDLGCGWRIGDEEIDFLDINIVGRRKGDHKPYREQCAAEDGLFFEETTRSYFVKDGVFYDTNKTDKLGNCVYGQEFFTVDLKDDENDDE